MAMRRRSPVILLAVAPEQGEMSCHYWNLFDDDGVARYRFRVIWQPNA